MKNKIFVMFSVMLLFCLSLFAQEGFLRIVSVPEGAAIEVEGRKIGQTPLLTVFEPGEFTLRAELAGYQRYTENIKVVENEVTLVQITMEREVRRPLLQRLRRTTGSLTIKADREDANIYLDGYRVKDSPPVTISEVDAGVRTVILVSGDYAKVARVVIQPGRTAVLEMSFDELREKLASRIERDRTAELEAKRQALPAKIELSLEHPAQRQEGIPLLGETDLVTVKFQYRKIGEDKWQEKELQSRTRQEDSFNIEKGLYEIQVTSTHYKEPAGIVNIFLGSKKEKIKEHIETLELDVKPDVRYTYSIIYDGRTEFSYKLNEEELNTVVE